MLDCAEIAQALWDSRDLSMWFADGSNYPGTQKCAAHEWFEEGWRQPHAALRPSSGCWWSTSRSSRRSITPTLPTGAWRYRFRQAAGPKAKVLVDTGHHLPGANIEQIVAWLLDWSMLGGFHFNDRKYADDDLTLGSIDPYEVFRIFHEIATANWRPASGGHRVHDRPVPQSEGQDRGDDPDGVTAQELFAKAALVDQEAGQARPVGDAGRAEERCREAFSTDVRPMVKEWREARKLPAEPLKALKQSGYVEKINKERGAKNANSVTATHRGTGRKGIEQGRAATCSPALFSVWRVGRSDGTRVG